MRIERIITKQGHPVPKTAYTARGPFPPELYQRPEVIVDYVPEDYIPDGTTAQNNFIEPKKFQCSLCGEVMYEHKTLDHKCEDTEDGTNS